MDELESGFLARFGSLFPGWEGEASPHRAVLDSIRYRSLERGASILREGETCRSLPLVIDGAIRVFKRAENGREITLYRIEAGECCILSSACATGLLPFPASARAETDTRAAFLPLAEVRHLLATCVAFRDFILGQYAARLAGIFELVEEVAFSRVDRRLKEWLLASGEAQEPSLVRSTHQEIADHIGSSREVVSRILKDWEDRGALDLSRGEIRLAGDFESLPL